MRHDRKLDAWSTEKAREMLGAGASADNFRALTRELASLTYGARARNAMHGLALFPPSASSLAAILDIKRLVPDRTYPTGTDDTISMIMTWAALQLGDRLAAMADAIAETVKITPT